MNTTDLACFEKDGIELYINTITGECFASAKGYSNMSGIDYGTIKKRCQRGGLPNSEIPTEQGLRWGTLINEDTIAEWLPKDNSSMATKLIKLGVRVFLHTLAGYQVTSTVIEQTKPKTEKEFLKLVLDEMWEDISNTFPEIDKHLIKGAKLNGYSRLFPELKEDVEEAKYLISATSTEAKLPMSPTELGIIFAQKHCLAKVSAQKVNQALLIEELQIKSNDQLCPYQLTIFGEKYGELQLETCKGHNKTVYRIRWYEDVISLIENTLLKLVTN